MALPPGKEYERLTAKADAYIAIETSQNGMRPEAVARRIADAVEVTSPKPRQLFLGRSRLLAAFLGAVPDRVADRAKLNTMGLR